MRTLPIRMRMTLWYFAFFMVAGLVLSVASWLLLRQSLTTVAKHELEERIDDLQSFLKSQTQTTLRYPLDLRAELAKQYGPKDEGKYLQVLDENGNWLYRSQRDSISLPLESLPQAAARLVDFHSTRHALGSLSRTFSAAGHNYSVAAAMSVDPSRAVLARFRRDLLLLTPIVLLLATAAGHTLSRKALRPVAAIAMEARRINDRNLALRLPTLNTLDELSHLSETLNQMLERIEASFRGIRAFTANASHELRTPISLIRARVEICLCFPRTAEQYRRVLEEVQSETVRMTALLENLLGLARADAGVESIKWQAIDLGDLVNDAANEWRPIADRYALQIIVVQPETPVWILGDPVSFRRLLRILIDNACRYTPADGRITLRAAAYASIAELTVRDTGSGIAPEHIGRIFDRFYRVPRSSGAAPGGSGSGLGLSLARMIAEQHQARIDVDSAPNKGSTFCVSMREHHAITVGLS